MKRTVKEKSDFFFFKSFYLRSSAARFALAGRAIHEITRNGRKTNGPEIYADEKDLKESWACAELFRLRSLTRQALSDCELNED